MNTSDFIVRRKGHATSVSHFVHWTGWGVGNGEEIRVCKKGSYYYGDHFPLVFSTFLVLVCKMLLVGSVIHKFLDAGFSICSDLNFDKPAVLEWRCIDSFWTWFKGLAEGSDEKVKKEVRIKRRREEITNLVDFNNFTRHWHVDITGSFHRFNRTKTVTKEIKLNKVTSWEEEERRSPSREFITNRWESNKNNITKSITGMLWDTNGANITI